jgi:hypothetical protein
MSLFFPQAKNWPPGRIFRFTGVIAEVRLDNSLAFFIKDAVITKPAIGEKYL